MKKLVGFIVLVCVLASCQKGISWDDLNTTSGTGSGKKLVKLTQKNGSDSAIATYKYNSANSLIEYSAVQVAGGVSGDLDITFARNSSNIITQSSVTSTQLASFGISNIVTNYIYDATNSRYTYSITKVTISGITYRDSIIYSYDTNNRLVYDIEYADGGNGSGYDISAKEEYTYVGNNVVTAKEYSADIATGTFTLDETATLEFDTKINPLHFTADAVPLRVVDLYNIFYSANNVTKETRVATNPTTTTIGTYTYTYNSDNMPATAIVSDGTTTYNFTYFYQ